MKFSDILRKLGIVRSGVVRGTYKSYKDMPDELMYDNVFNKKKDLIGKTDLVDARSVLISSRNRYKKGSVVLLVILLLLSATINLFVGVIIGYAWLFWVVVVCWILFVCLLFRYRAGYHRVGMVIGFFIVFLIVAAGALFVSIPSGSPVKKGSTSSGSALPDCGEVARRYNNRVFPISSSKDLQGTVAFKVNLTTCGYTVTWHTLFASKAIKPNLVKGTYSDYNYIADIVFDAPASHPADGTIDPVYQNKNALPQNPFVLNIPYSWYVTPEVASGEKKHVVTDTFFHSMSQSGPMLSQTVVNDVLSVKKIAIYDAVPFSEVDKTDQGLNYLKVDQDAAIEKGTPLIEYPVTVLE